MTLIDLDLFSKSIANLIERTPSENRDIGWSIAVQLIPRSPRTKVLGPLSFGGFFASHPLQFSILDFRKKADTGDTQVRLNRLCSSGRRAQQSSHARRRRPNRARALKSRERVQRSYRSSYSLFG